VESLIVFTQRFRFKSQHKNYHSAGVQIKFVPFAEQKQSAISDSNHRKLKSTIAC